MHDHYKNYGNRIEITIAIRLKNTIVYKKGLKINENFYNYKDQQDLYILKKNQIGKLKY